MLNQSPHYAPAALALFTTPRLHITHSLCSRCSPFSHTSATSHPFRIVFVFKCHSINLILNPNHESRSCPLLKHTLLHELPPASVQHLLRMQLLRVVGFCFVVCLLVLILWLICVFPTLLVGPHWGPAVISCIACSWGQEISQGN